MKHQPTDNRARPGFVALLVGAFFLAIIAVWAVKRGSPAPSPEAGTTVVATAAGEAAPSSAPAGLNRVRSNAKARLAGRLAPATGAVAPTETASVDRGVASNPASRVASPGSPTPGQEAETPDLGTVAGESAAPLSPAGGIRVTSRANRGGALAPATGPAAATDVAAAASANRMTAAPTPAGAAEAAVSVPGGATGLGTQTPVTAAAQTLLDGVSDPINRARPLFANPQWWDTTGLTDSSGSNPTTAAADASGADTILNGVDAHREAERLTRERIREMRPVRAAAIVAGGP